MKIKKNIIYLCDAEKKASGGAKIIYQHSEIINSLKNFSSEVLHLKLKKRAKWSISISKKISFRNYAPQGWQSNQVKAAENFRHTWFKNKIKSKNDFIFNSKKDFIIIPEIYAHLADDLFLKKKIDYAIFVQNGYAINSTNNFKKLKKVYSNAKCILSYSKDITECILINFPKLKKKIFKVTISVNVNKYKFKKEKKNLITYMSRKLPEHSAKVISILRLYLPAKWKVKDLNNMSEREVFKNLNFSKIFLSFSHLEGLGIPPIEAALLNNKVIGYTGEGGNEYWKYPIFTSVKSGDIKRFAKLVIKNLSFKNNSYSNHRKKLHNRFSKSREANNIQRLLKYISNSQKK